ncbi:MAG: hypothetical protein NT096_08640 [Proteobacteria bacterium]|jgi:hypothetical protein|nr:hypothetical protein [Pseudomonadota bacterium]
MLSEKAKRELRELAESDSFRKDMETVRANRHNPFVKDGKVDVDAYLEFVEQYNEFINHEPKPFRRMIDKDMRL